MEIRSRPSTDTYRESWDLIFNPKPSEPVCQVPGCQVSDAIYMGLLIRTHRHPISRPA